MFGKLFTAEVYNDKKHTGHNNWCWMLKIRFRICFYLFTSSVGYIDFIGTPPTDGCYCVQVVCLRRQAHRFNVSVEVECLTHFNECCKQEHENRIICCKVSKLIYSYMYRQHKNVHASCSVRYRYMYMYMYKINLRHFV